MQPDNEAMMKGRVEKVATYFRQVFQEFLKISWTTKVDLIKLTKIVLGASILGGLSIYFADLMLQKALNIVDIFLKWVIG